MTPETPKTTGRPASDGASDASGAAAVARDPAAARRGLLLCAGGLLLDLLIVCSAVWGPPTVSARLGFILLHACACAVTAVGLHVLLSPGRARLSRGGFLFLCALTFFMPLFAALGLVGGMLAERLFPLRPPPPQPFLSIPIPALPGQPLLVSARPEYGDGALSAMLRYCPSPERRVSAVLSVRQLRDRNDAEVLRLALTDKVDDVRLLAYSILDRKEQAFNARLQTLQGQLQAEPLDAEQRARLKKRIAQTNFELIELGLSRGEMQTYLLSEGRSQIDAALAQLPDDRESLFLLGCIALRQGDLPTAEKAFLRAQVLGMALEKVLPYLAEVAFYQRRFSMVTHYLRAIDPLYFRTQPLLSSVAAHWLPEESSCPPK